jgi:hypothetical protein
MNLYINKRHHFVKSRLFITGKDSLYLPHILSAIRNLNCLHTYGTRNRIKEINSPQEKNPFISNFLHIDKLSHDIFEICHQKLGSD